MRKRPLVVLVCLLLATVPRAAEKRFITRKGSAEVHLDCRPADRSGRLGDRLRARDGERKREPLRDVTVHGGHQLAPKRRGG